MQSFGTCMQEKIVRETKMTPNWHMNWRMNANKHRQFPKI